MYEKAKLNVFKKIEFVGEISNKLPNALLGTNFEEHLRTTAPEYHRKISPLLVLEKPMLDGKRQN